MSKFMAVIGIIIIGIITIGLTGFCVINIMQNGFDTGALPVMIGGGIAGLFIAIKRLVA